VGYKVCNSILMYLRKHLILNVAYIHIFHKTLGAILYCSLIPYLSALQLKYIQNFNTYHPCLHTIISHQDHFSGLLRDLLAVPLPPFSVDTVTLLNGCQRSLSSVQNPQIASYLRVKEGSLQWPFCLIFLHRSYHLCAIYFTCSSSCFL
jgi:hypothetical protein